MQRSRYFRFCIALVAILVTAGLSLQAFGEAQKGWIGVRLEDIQPEWVDVVGVKGASVVEVFKGGPADKAGLKKGDIIIWYKNTPVTDAAGLRMDIAASPIGSAVPLTVLRDRLEQSIVVRIEPTPEQGA